jgi:isoleucyl-tRNA synthetase
MPPQDVEISSQDIEGWLVASSGNLTVALDITISDELRYEGIARELVNRIQNLRKDSGFEVTDRIEIALQKTEILESAIAHNAGYIKTETLANTLQLTEQIENGLEIKFDDVETKMVIKKV